MSLSFSSKARTLALFQQHVRSARVAPLTFFTVAEWRKAKDQCLTRMTSSLGSGPFIVRSSSLREDGASHSNAGAFLSVLHVDKTGLEEAIERVIASYGEASENDEVLVQPMLTQVVRAGVAFSHDPNTLSPYRIINWSEGENTSAITGGRSGRTWQSAALSPLEPPLELRPVIALLEELLTLTGDIPVDIEFAVTQEADNAVLWLLQARPLVLTGDAESAETQAERLTLIAEKVARGMGPHPFLIGRRTVYGVMPDWNPAEIIGIRPKPLALSLYRELVTDAIWAYQRSNYGYRNLRSFPLMPHFFGLPYIDVRLCFNSFIPASLEEGLAGRLVDYYIERLLNEPTLHDKVEFEIVFSCYSLDVVERLRQLEKAGFSSHDQTMVADSLRDLTNHVIHPKNGLWRKDAAKLDTLESRREMLLRSSADPLERIYWLIEDAKRYGTLPFAGLARAGFMAVQILRSLVHVGVFSSEDYDAFMAGTSTVGSQLGRDRAMLEKSTFLSRYGHLRPGTYDILSPRYDEAPELYFDWSNPPPLPSPAPPFKLTLPQMRQVAQLLEEHGLHTDAVGLFDFLQAGIELRELAKFHFTRNLSDALSLTLNYGLQHGFSAEDMAFCDITTIKELHIGAVNPRVTLASAIEQGKERYKETLATSLPPVITHPNDIWAFEWPVAVPNFITQKHVTAPVTSYTEREKLAGAIVCIPHADPGFDWLFSYPIAGLVTAWGGANSHMAIRAGELGLPAVIGAGEALYHQWSHARYLRIDCAAKKVEMLASS